MAVKEVHTVEQGETLSSIARDYGFQKYETIYFHESNEEFRNLRYDPNLIYPGDKINIPEKKPKTIKLPTNKAHQLVVSLPPKDRFILKLTDSEDNRWSGAPYKLILGSIEEEGTVSAMGKITVEMENDTPREGELHLYLDEETDEATHVFDVLIGHLDPFDTISGIQARLNLLGYPCGEVTGEINEETESAVRAFQIEQSLTVDGDPGPLTQDKLYRIYGF